jgi:hypothetical protein
MKASARRKADSRRKGDGRRKGDAQKGWIVFFAFFVRPPRTLRLKASSVLNQQQLLFQLHPLPR